MTYMGLYLACIIVTPPTPIEKFEAWARESKCQGLDLPILIKRNWYQSYLILVLPGSPCSSKDLLFRFMLFHKLIWQQ